MKFDRRQLHVSSLLLAREKSFQATATREHTAAVLSYDLVDSLSLDTVDNVVARSGNTVAIFKDDDFMLLSFSIFAVNRG